jgi:carbonic anhydrase/acetyltransferase-like protein (isoleucine patch superfamily)
MAVIQSSVLGDFALANLGTTTSPGTVVGREALLLNGSATYANQKLPERSICWGNPARPRVLDSTMWEREFFFHGKSWPTWERQATAEELKSYTVPR